MLPSTGAASIPAHQYLAWTWSQTGLPLTWEGGREREEGYNFSTKETKLHSAEDLKSMVIQLPASESLVL